MFCINYLNLLILLVVCLLFAQCKVITHWWNNYRIDEKAFLYMNSCIKKWDLVDLKTSKMVHVLRFDAKYKQTLVQYPNLIIGIDEKNDTIAIIDIDFNEIISEGDTVRACPREWNLVDKGQYFPIARMDKKRSKNKLYCCVKEAYYGKIEKISNK